LPQLGLINGVRERADKKLCELPSIWGDTNPESPHFRRSPEFTGLAVTVAVNHGQKGVAGLKSYSEFGGECGIRTRGGGFADRYLQFVRVS